MIDERTLQDGVTDLPHQFQQEVEIVDRVQAQSQELSGLEQMVQLGTGEALAGVALALLLDGGRVLRKSGVA